MKRDISIDARTFHIRGVFRISRGSKTIAEALQVRLSEGGAVGRGECIPYARYDETPASVRAQLEAVAPAIVDGASIEELQSLLPPGSARAALDCALWDLRAGLTGQSVAAAAGLSHPLRPVDTCFTLSLGDPADMAAAAKAASGYPMLKLKFGGDGDLDRVRAVRQAAPTARLMADANESWRPEHLERFLPEMAALGLELLEQPLPAGDDDALVGFRSPVPLAADESCRDLRSIEAIRDRYAIANIKLDKTGGLTEALALARAARAQGMRIMVGCMVASSWSMAPGLVVAQLADVVHLDGPLLLLDDMEPGFAYAGATLTPDATVWSV